MLSGTLVTIIGLMPVGLAHSSAGEYAGNILWIMAFALILSRFVAMAFKPYLGVKLLPDIKPTDGGHHAIYDTPGYRRLRAIISWAVRHKFIVAGAVVPFFAVSVVAMGKVRQQFPGLRPARGPGGGAPAGGNQHRSNQKRRKAGRGVAALGSKLNEQIMIRSVHG
ncbi:hypothetical protein GCM10017653_47910 [Ancylobacter defluvii]|uniref:Uncharacterized protein n=1 Tax=Ancylobacter defluvii TaxID=1282440 RepID=A0A9W6K1Y1_9HYPH|nr:hypothetical protein GCM10017653_47910 [Ancylobacter defluvii]